MKSGLTYVAVFGVVTFAIYSVLCICVAGPGHPTFPRPTSAPAVISTIPANARVPRITIRTNPVPMPTGTQDIVTTNFSLVDLTAVLSNRPPVQTTSSVAYYDPPDGGNQSNEHWLSFQWSTNLANWATLTSNLEVSGSTNIINVVHSTSTKMFFRTVGTNLEIKGRVQ